MHQRLCLALAALSFIIDVHFCEAAPAPLSEPGSPGLQLRAPQPPPLRPLPPPPLPPRPPQPIPKRPVLAPPSPPGPSPKEPKGPVPAPLSPLRSPQQVPKRPLPALPLGPKPSLKNPKEEPTVNTGTTYTDLDHTKQPGSSGPKPKPKPAKDGKTSYAKINFEESKKLAAPQNQWVSPANLPRPRPILEEPLPDSPYYEKNGRLYQNGQPLATSKDQINPTNSKARFFVSERTGWHKVRFYMGHEIKAAGPVKLGSDPDLPQPQHVGPFYEKDGKLYQNGQELPTSKSQIDIYNGHARWYTKHADGWHRNKFLNGATLEREIPIVVGRDQDSPSAKITDPYYQRGGKLYQKGLPLATSKEQIDASNVNARWFIKYPDGWHMAKIDNGEVQVLEEPISIYFFS